ncbi:hypothetical protein Tco_1292295 [Tanacetum coccineum]
MNHVNATASTSTSNDTKPKKPGDVKMNRLVIHPGKNNRARLHSDNVASTSTVKAATSTKFKIQMDVKMKGPLHMEEKVKDYRFGIHSKRVVDDVKNVASTSMATSVETKNAPYKFKKAKTDLRNQMDIEAAEGLLMFLGDHPHSPMGESSVQVPTSTTEMHTNVHELGDTVNGGIKEVRDFDLNELPSMEEDT